MKTRSALEICLPLALFVAACALSLPGVIVPFVKFLAVIARRAPSSKDLLCCNISSKHAFTKPLINKRF